MPSIDEKNTFICAAIAYSMLRTGIEKSILTCLSRETVSKRRNEISHDGGERFLLVKYENADSNVSIWRGKDMLLAEAIHSLTRQTKSVKFTMRHF